MREAIGGTWIFQIVIFFILLFTGFMCLSINQSKAYAVKSAMLGAIESHNGLYMDDIQSGDPALEEIVAALQDRAYRTVGKCPSSETSVSGEEIIYTGYNRDGHIDSNNPVFCIAKVETADAYHPEVSELPSMAYYRVVVFYQLDLPIFREVFNFTLKGDTKLINVSR